uniref:Uncharacterized protein n=1 Tax=Avena sativa TaxID=4498 RepID=A0ACD5YQZ1_AVESA
MHPVESDLITLVLYSLQPLFKHVESGSEIREKIICFLRDKVFPVKAELLRPQAEMERYITDLIKKSVHDVTGLEFKLFMDFLRSLSIFGDSAPRESFQELIEIIQAQADLDAQFDVSDIDHMERWTSCMYMALPIFTRGASSSKFLNYFTKQIVPVFDKIPEEKKLDLLKMISASSPFAAAQDSRQLLPSVVQLLKKYMPGKKVDDINHNYIECLLYAFHHLAHKTPNTTNSLCGYKIVTGQPSDRLGEDFSEHNKDFTERLTGTEETVRAASKRLTQGMADFSKALSSAKTAEEKSKIKEDQQKSTVTMRSYNNILAMSQPLQVKSPLFIGDKKITLSWMELPKKPAATTAGGKRTQPPSNGIAPVSKKGRGEGGVHNNQLVNRAFEALSHLLIWVFRASLELSFSVFSKVHKCTRKLESSYQGCFLYLFSFQTVCWLAEFFLKFILCLHPSSKSVGYLLLPLFHKISLFNKPF